MSYSVSFFLTFTLFFSIPAFSQTEIRGITEIRTDVFQSDSLNHRPNKKIERWAGIRPIHKSKADIEIRLYEHFSLSDTKKLRLLKFKRNKWAAFIYAEQNNPKGLKIKKPSISDFTSIIRNLLSQNLMQLPDMGSIESKFGKTVIIKDKVAQQKIRVMDGTLYTLELKFSNSFRIYSFNNPDTYLKHYHEVEELKQYSSILSIFEKAFDSQQ